MLTDPAIAGKASSPNVINQQTPLIAFICVLFLSWHRQLIGAPDCGLCRSQSSCNIRDMYDLSGFSRRFRVKYDLGAKSNHRAVFAEQVADRSCAAETSLHVFVHSAT